jgi:uncharacterized membrane protein
MAAQNWSDERVDTVIGRLLRTGVILAATVVAIGGVIYLTRHGWEPANYRLFHGEPSEYTSISRIIAALPTLQGRVIVQFGLLLLVATPVARVVFGAAAFALEREGTYVIATLIVLAVLLFSLAGGFGGG